MHESSEADGDVLLRHLSFDDVLLVEDVKGLPEVRCRVNTTEPIVPHVQAQAVTVSAHSRNERSASNASLFSGQVLFAHNGTGGSGEVGGDCGQVGDWGVGHYLGQEGVDVGRTASSHGVVLGFVVVGWLVPIVADVDESHVVETAVDDLVLDSVEASRQEWILLHDFLVVLVTASQSE